MDRVSGQNAIQIAVHTLKDRCLTLQQRVTVLEEENRNLRVKCSRLEQVESTSLTEMDRLRAQLTDLTEQKHQLLSKIKLIADENREMWAQLGQLTAANKNMSVQLSQLKDSMNVVKAPSTNLVRSRTFTQDEPHTAILQRNFEETASNLSAQMEEISLKLLNNKREWEEFNAEIDATICITDSLGFYCSNDEEQVSEEYETALAELRDLRELVGKQQKALQKALERIGTLQEFAGKKCNCDTVEKTEKSTNTEDIPQQPEQSLEEKSLKENSNLSQFDKVCPLCSRHFYTNTSFEEFQLHVEEHFTHNTDSYELL